MLANEGLTSFARRSSSSTERWSRLLVNGGRHALIFFGLRAANAATQDVFILPVARFRGVRPAEQAPRATQARLRLGRKPVQMADVAEVHYAPAEVGGDLPAAPVTLVLHELLRGESKTTSSRTHGAMLDRGRERCSRNGHASTPERRPR